MVVAQLLRARERALGDICLPRPTSLFLRRLCSGDLLGEITSRARAAIALLPRIAFLCIICTSTQSELWPLFIPCRFSANRYANATVIEETSALPNFARRPSICR